MALCIEFVDQKKEKLLLSENRKANNNMENTKQISDTRRLFNYKIPFDIRLKLIAFPLYFICCTFSFYFLFSLTFSHS